MSKMHLDPRSANRLAKIAGIFGSEHANERAAAAAQAHALVSKAGATWSELIPGAAECQQAVRPAWQQIACACAAHAHRLHPLDAELIRDMQLARWRPTEGQLIRLTQLHEQIFRGARRYPRDR